jgi:hypothetical protein
MMKSSPLLPIVFCVAVALFTAACAGQPANETKPPAEKSGQPANVRTSGDVVKISAAEIDLPSGGSAELAIPISIQPGYHVNANPATFDYLIPTEITVHKSDDLTFGKPVYPASEKRKFQFAEQPLAVYEGNIHIKLPIQATPGAKKGTRSMTVRLRVQACDEEKCFPPDIIEVGFIIDVK